MPFGSHLMDWTILTKGVSKVVDKYDTSLTDVNSPFDPPPLLPLPV